jgi:1A family penicillin-binding protein
VSLPVAAISLAGTLFWSLHDLSLQSVIEPNIEPVILLQASDGQELSRTGPVRGQPVAFEDVPSQLIDAVIAIEDRRFFEHRGIDPWGVLRAFMRNLHAGQIREGGSTITQQLARVLIREDDRTIKRKIRESVLALWMEARLSKKEILTRYLNHIYLGAGATGVSAAAQAYFNKPVDALSLPESAMIAGLIQAPSQLNPLRNLPAARKRAAVVLDAMVEDGKIDRRSAQAAKQKPARLRPGRAEALAGTWFGDWAHEEARKLAGRTYSRNAGMVWVQTSFSPELQSLAENVVRDVMRKQGKSSGVQQVALVAMRPDGAVVAMVGGRNYSESQYNRAVQAMRQPGSTFKLFVYFAALRNGYSIHDTIEDAPFAIERWKPKNFDQRYHGLVSLADAFAQSLNVATARLALTVGIDEVVEAARFLGIDAPLNPTPSLALGSSEVSLLDLTGAYASVRAGTAPVEPRAIEALSTDDEQSWIRPAHSVAGHSLGDQQNALIELLGYAVEHGTGRAAALNGFVAGKTGTTENHKDAWFVGFTEDLVAGVWVGNDDNRPMNKVTGGKLPAQIFREFMARASELSGQDARVAQNLEGELQIIGSIQAKPRPEASWTDANALIAGAFSQTTAERGLSRSSPSCDLQACARAYRSFRAEDCTYQPYRGERRLCTKSFSDGEEELQLESRAGLVRSCSFEACERTYRSFRAADCTYQPYRGARKLCSLEDDVGWRAAENDQGDEEDLWFEEYGSYDDW